jgi:predicted transcriptional regulator
VTIVGRPGGWSVIFKLNAGEKWLAAQRSKLVRVWRSLDRCVAFMKEELGVARFDVLDASRHSPDGLTPRVRADAAARMKHAHETAAHDRWFQDQVNEGLRDLDAGLVTQEETHDAQWAKRRAALQKRIVTTHKRRA